MISSLAGIRLSVTPDHHSAPVHPFLLLCRAVALLLCYFAAGSVFAFVPLAAIQAIIPLAVTRQLRPPNRRLLPAYSSSDALGS
eukprot:12170637-Alexandrium_andersonii.AAC.1